MGRRQDIVREWGGMAVPGRVEMKRVDLEETWIWIQILALLFTSFVSSSKSLRCLGLLFRCAVVSS